MKERSDGMEITSTSLLGKFEVTTNCSHNWNLVARRPTMCPGELALQDVKWCGRCGALSIGVDSSDTHVYTHNVTDQARGSRAGGNG